jgi:hypothetical protein
MGADPTNGADPSDPGSWNKYAYAQSDPMNYFDPSGNGRIAVLKADCTYSATGPEETRVTFTKPCDVIMVDNTKAQPRKTLPNPDKGGLSRKAPCPEVPVHIGVADDQIAQNVAAAQAESDLLWQQAQDTASKDPSGDTSADSLYAGWMAGWLAQQFEGAWNYKGNPALQAQNTGFNLRDYGNFNFGAVMEGLGASYYFAQNAAGIAQLFINIKWSSGVPAVLWPYGDSTVDAQNIWNGYIYEQRVQLGDCK